MKISIIAALTLDGKIARTPNHFPEWTGKADKKHFSSVTKRAGVIIMGSKTFDLINKKLPNRKIIVMTRKKKRILNKKNLIFTNDSAESIIKNLKNQGNKHIIVCGGAQINQIFIEKGLIDELIITLSPLIFGTGISLFSKKLDLKLKLKSIKQIDKNSICIIYKLDNKTK